MPMVNCHRCATQYLLPDELYKAAKSSESINFYCPYGHAAHYPAGETEETRLRRERDRLKQQQARLEDEKREAWVDCQRQRERAEKAEKATKRLKKRSSAGTCPCCSRTFSNMAEHMKHQHPGFVADGGAKVVPIKRTGSVT